MGKERLSVKLAVYDLENNFLGYKSDTFWTLDKSFGKEHTYMDEERLIDNFIYGLNGRQKTGTLLDILLKNNEKQLTPIKEQDGCIIKSQLYYTPYDIMRKFKVFKNEKGLYQYEEIN